MSVMQIFDEDGRVMGPALHDERIQATLQRIGVRLEHWPVKPLQESAGQEDIMAAYQDYIDELNEEYGFDFVDVSALWPKHPKKRELRSQFSAEHTHSDDEVRFFVEGCGSFYFHVGKQVYAVLCEQGDLISVPAKTLHWFDMGANPDFTLIRFFPTRDGWLAENTGDEVAGRLPDLDTFIASLQTNGEQASER